MRATTTVDETVVLSHPIGPDGLFVLRIDRGEVSVRGVSGDTATVRSLRGRTLSGFDIDAGVGSLSIVDGATGDHRRPSAVRLAADVPHGATVVLEAETAELTAIDLRGEQRYRTASGDIELRGVSGTVTVEAISGDLEVAAVGSASLSVRSVSGDVSVAADILVGLRATTTSGDLRIDGRFAGDGAFDIETVSGDTLLGSRSDLRIDAETISGDVGGDRSVRREEIDGRQRLIVGAGGPTIAFRSTSGDLLVQDHRDVPVSAATPVDSVPAPVESTPTAEPAEDAADLAVLRALERGEIDVEEAGRRLAALEAEAARVDAATGGSIDA